MIDYIKPLSHTLCHTVSQSAMNKLCVLLGDTTIQAFVNIDRNLKEFIVAYILTIKILFYYVCISLNLVMHFLCQE